MVAGATGSETGSPSSEAFAEVVRRSVQPPLTEVRIASEGLVAV